MPDKDAMLLARTAAALRAEGKHVEADQLDGAVERIRAEDDAARTPGADLSGVRSGAFRVRDDAGDDHDHPVPKPPPRREPPPA